MSDWKLVPLVAVWIAALAGAAQAKLCDFRLSEMIAKRAPALASETADDSTLGKLRELGRVSGEAKDFFTLVDGGGLGDGRHGRGRAPLQGSGRPAGQRGGAAHGGRQGSFPPQNNCLKKANDD